MSTTSTYQVDDISVAVSATTRFGWDACLADRRGGDDVSVCAAARERPT